MKTTTEVVRDMTETKESNEVNFILLDRDDTATRIRHSKFISDIVPRLRSKKVTCNQLVKSYSASVRIISYQYMYHILEDLVSMKICKKTYNKSLGCNEYKF